MGNGTRQTPKELARTDQDERDASPRHHHGTGAVRQRNRAFASAFAYLLVTSSRGSIDNALLMPHHGHRFAGIPT
jgi:hypothetical protein